MVKSPVDERERCVTRERARCLTPMSAPAWAKAALAAQKKAEASLAAASSCAAQQHDSMSYMALARKVQM